MPAVTGIRAAIDAYLTKSADLGTPSAPILASVTDTLLTGTLDTQADKVWGDSRVLTASASEDLDLFGTLLDAFGDLFSPVEIVAIIVIADDANTNDVVVGGAAATQFVGPFGAATHTHKVRPGGFYFWYAPGGFANAAGADFLRVANGGGGTSVTYSIVVVGRSA